MIGRAGIGVDNIDVAAATQRGIVVMNMPYGNSITTAEHAIAMMFVLARSIPPPTADPGRQVGEVALLGVGSPAEDAGRRWPGRYRLIVADRRTACKHEGVA